MVTLVIDDKRVAVPAGSTVLEAARLAGVYIPTLCYHPDLSSFGKCRVCTVEANGNMVHACVAQVEEGLVVWTDTPEVAELRKKIVVNILAGHNPDCQTCARNGDCELQAVSAFVGIENKSLAGIDRKVSELPADTSNPFFTLDHTRCILCGICIRSCKEINGVAALAFSRSNAGTRQFATVDGKPLAESKCESCGECVERCPTGALIRKNGERPTRKVKTICPYCGVGCGIYLGVRGNRVAAVYGDRDNPANDGQLCVKGRFGYQFINHRDRLTLPLIKRDGKFSKVSWDEALALTAGRLQAVQEKYGPEALGGISSARATNESNYLFQKLLRSLGTNSVDCCARL